MKYAIVIARTLLGLMFLVFGLNYWFKFIPMPQSPPPPELVKMYIGALMGSDYMGAVKVCELIGGLLVLSGRYTAVGLLFLGPVIFNILCYDVFLAKAFNPISTAAAVLAVFLLIAHRDRFAALAKG